MVTNGKSTEATNLPSPAHGREPALSGRLGLGEDTKGAEGEGLRSSLDRLLSDIDPSVARALDKALAGEDITVDEATALLEAEGSANVNAIVLAADELRRRTGGDVVTYIINRNINFTNVCIKHCTFCAFSRDHREEEGYFLPMEEVIRRTREAYDLGAREVCVQAGLPPKMDGYYYVDLTKAIKLEMPDMHIHGFSPHQGLYGAVRAKCSI